MIRYLLFRLSGLLPKVLGISLVTFVLINLAVVNPQMGGRPNSMGSDDSAVDRDTGRTFGLHLPLFINLQIEDIHTRTLHDIEALDDPATSPAAVRSLERAGAAVIPHLLPHLSEMSKSAQTAALKALKTIAGHIHLGEDLAGATDPISFWDTYYDIYGADFSPVRAKRLARRVARRNDHLALTELERLGTYSLPFVMELLDNPDSPTTTRVVTLLNHLTNRHDPMPKNATATQRQEVVIRWQAWWNERYDLYTSFDGVDALTGAITETRYFKWLERVFTFDFGVSSRDGRPIRAKIAERLPVTLTLTVMAMLLAYLLAVPLGVLSAVKRDSLFDRTISMVTFVFYSIPGFLVAMLLLRAFGTSHALGRFFSPDNPVEGLGRNLSLWNQLGISANQLVLPVACLALISIAVLTRYQRMGMLRVNELDFMRTARAKGLSEFRVIVRHGLRNGIIPLITMAGMQLPFLISGSVVIERIFGIPGMGDETFEAIGASDYAWLVAVVTVTAVLTSLGMVASDLVVALVDPRIAPGRRFGRTV